MVSQIETWILGALQNLFDAWGWLGVAAMLVFENATGITPSEIILGLAGWMLIEKHGLSPSVIFVGGLYAATGSVLGSSVAYWAARLGGRPLVERLARWVRIAPHHITRIEQQFNRWGAWLVLFGRIIPGVRTLVSIPAGLARMPYGLFCILTFAGAYIWCTLLIGVGYLLGHEWPLISHYIKQAFPYLFVGGGLMLVMYVWFNRRSELPAYAQVRRSDE